MVNRVLLKCFAGSLLIAAVLALPACVTLGPDYQEPDVAWLNDWHSDLYGQIGQPEQQTETDLRFWTQIFNEPVLNELVETARRENPTLRIAGLRILESRALLGIAGSNRYPQLNQVSGAAGRGTATRAVGRISASRATRPASDMGWELDFWGRFRRGIESANAAYFASITSSTTCRCC